MGAVLTPDLLQAQRFLDYLDQEGTFTFQTFDDKKRKQGVRAKVLHGSLRQHAEELTHLQQAGAGVFVMVNAGNGIIHPGKQTCRCTENVVRVRALWIDLDGSPLEPVLAAHHPDIVVESSPERWHGYWLTNDCPLDQFSDCQLRIATKFKGDPAIKDLPRVMRVPGFWHQKHTPFQTRIIHPEAP